MFDVDRIIRLPTEKLVSRVRRHGRVRGPYNERGKRFTREELIEFLKDRGYKTMSALQKGRTSEDPRLYEILREFGSWSEAKRLALSEEPPSLDRYYILKSIVEFDLWHSEKYRELQKKRPDILPSLYFVRKQFGSWKIARQLAAALSTKASLLEYVALRDKKGKIPTDADCRKAGVGIDKLKNLFGNKHQLDLFIASMEEVL